MVVYSGRTVEQAIEKGLKDLSLPRMRRSGLTDGR